MIGNRRLELEREVGGRAEHLHMEMQPGTRAVSRVPAGTEAEQGAVQRMDLDVLGQAGGRVGWGGASRELNGQREGGDPEPTN